MLEHSPHEPVLCEQVVTALMIRPGGIYLDGTVGFGGHASALLKHMNAPGLLIGLDRDPIAVQKTRETLHLNYQENLFSIHHANYRHFDHVLDELKIKMLDGILLDVGVSSFDIDNAHRGFSYQQDGPLDMRFDQSTGKSLHHMLTTASEADLAGVIRMYGEERFYKKIAATIVRQLQAGKMNTTMDLRGAVTSVVFGKYQVKSVARVFQALRIWVNDELNALADTLEKSVNFLRPGGRIAVISFHSLEDRLVKRFIQKQSITCVCPPELPICSCNTQPVLRAVTRKPVTADENEIRTNSRAASARLRVAEKL